LIIPIATFLTGTLSGIMLAGNDKDARMKALEAATRPTTVSPSPTTSSVSAPKPFTPVSPTASPFGSPAPTFSAPAPVVTGFGGKAAPPPAFEPEL
jgi:hypothetical protein